MKEEKRAMREKMKGLLSAIPAASLHEKSAALESRFLSSPEFISARSLLVYVSLPNEPETRGIIKRALELKKSVYAPKVEGDDICVCRLHGLSGLSPGRFGISEPPGEAKCELREFDVAIVPGLAFDLKGNRLGRGGGFYDRLLAVTKGELVGFAFDEQVVDKVPSAGHDVKVEKVFTDKRVVGCGK